jgi:hypothetical protein
VEDFRIYYDNGVGDWELIVTGYPSMNFMIDTLTPGVTYAFRVQSRNTFGYSDDSADFLILCATVPDPPEAPVTTTVASDVTIAWQEPKDNGSPITGYRVYLRSEDGTYIEETVYCENTPTLVTSK